MTTTPTRLAPSRLRPRGSLGLACALVVLTACSDRTSTDAGEGVVVTDSSGIRIVDLARLGAEDRWDLEELWTIGEVEGELLNGLRDRDEERGPQFLDADRIVLSEADGVVARVRVLEAATGALLTTVGRFGEGPGEFVRPHSPIPTPEGGAWISDPANRRLTRISPEGDIEGSTPLPNLGVLGNPEIHIGGETTFVWVSSNLGAGEEGSPLRRQNGVLARWTEEVVDTLRLFPGVEYVANGSALGGPPWGGRSLFAGSGDGVWLGDIARPEIGFYQANGLTTLVRWNAPEAAVTAEDRGAFLQHVEGLSPPGMWERMEPMMQAVLVIETKPHWYRLVPGDAGGIWVGTTERWGLPNQVEGPPPESEWVILDGDGRPVAEATTPVGFSLYDVRGDLAVGVQIDELGVERLRMLRIVRGR